jgi:hypothetical protein
MNGGRPELVWKDVRSLFLAGQGVDICWAHIMDEGVIGRAAIKLALGWVNRA